jgi:hypothetical protein
MIAIARSRVVADPELRYRPSGNNGRRARHRVCRYGLPPYAFHLKEIAIGIYGYP